MGTTDSFFATKKSWSKIKDSLLSRYLKPYLAKVAHTNQRILIADCFAGKGRFDDGELGSPLIIVEALRERFSDKTGAGYQFVCIEKKYFQELNNNLGNLDNVKCLEGDYEERMGYFLGNYSARKQNLFLYVDPYGIKSLRYDHFNQILQKGFNTVELMLNFNSFGFLREGCRLLKKQFVCCDTIDGESPEYEADTMSVDTMNSIVGSDFWQQIVEDFCSGRIKFVEAEERLSIAYYSRLKELFKHVLMIPIKKTMEHIPKYRICFGTNHPHGYILMADTMAKAWNEFRDEQREGQGVLFEFEYATAVDSCTQDAVKQHILEVCQSEVLLVDLLVALIDHFGVNFTESQYKKIIEEMRNETLEIRYDPPKIRGRRVSGLSFNNSDYRVYVRRASTWQPQLL